MFSLPIKIFTECNSLNDLPWDCYSPSLVITDKVLYNMGMCQPIFNILEKQKVSYETFYDIEPNPSLETVEKGVKFLLESSFKSVIAIGGGSVIDAAKAFIYFLKPASEHLNMAQTKPYFIAIPTTSGTGSEVTSFSVVTDTKNKIKIPLVSDYMLPDIALLDCIFTIKCPPKITAESGIDALVHSLEAYVSINRNEFTDAFVEKSIKIIFDNLCNVYTDGSDREGRTLMHHASCIAGIAFNNAGLGLNHAMAHAIGGRFHIPHGRANALLIPHIISYNAKEVSSRYQNISKILGLPAHNPEIGTMAIINAINYLMKMVNLESSILDFGISRSEFMDSIPLLAKNAKEDACLSSNPVVASISDIEKIYSLIV